MRRHTVVAQSNYSPGYYYKLFTGYSNQIVYS